MKTLLTLFAALTLFCLVLDNQVAMAQYPGQQWPQTTKSDSPDWSMEIGVKAYDRPAGDLGLPIIFDSVTNASLFSSDDASDLNTAPGAEVKWNFKNRWDEDWQLRWVGARWESSAFIDDDNLTAPFFFPAFDPDQIGFDYDSSLFSVELMKKRDFAPGMTIMGGVRYMNVKETIDATSSTFFTVPGQPAVTVTSLTSYDVRNHMFGLQLGGEFNRPLTRDIYLNSFFRFAGMVNPTRVEVDQSTSLSATVTSTERKKSTGTGVLEFGTRVYVDIFPGSLSSYIGYEGMFIDGIALAPAQLVTADLMGAVEVSNTPYFHSVTFGMKFDY